MDILSDFLQSVSVRCYVTTGTMAPLHWSIEYPGYEGVKLFFVEKGEVFIRLIDKTDWIHLVPGDTIVLFRPQRFVFATDSTAKASLAETLTYTVRQGLADYGGDDVVVFAGKMQLDPAFAELFFESMPTHLVIRGDEAQTVRLLMRRIHAERLEEMPGMHYATSRLIDLVMLEVLRIFLAQEDRQAPGLFSAMQDKRLMRALTAMHTDPQNNWTLPQLASAAGMSRSGFAAHFKARMGTAPLEYLTRWRIRLAAQKLRDTDESVKTIAAKLGFQSASAFSTAFKRVEGETPISWRETSRKELQAKLADHPPVWLLSDNA